MAGRHGPAPKERTRAPKAVKAPKPTRTGHPVRRFFVSIGATLVAFAIAASLAIPASASMHVSKTAAQTLAGQQLSVSTKVANTAVTRDQFKTGHIYKDGGPGVGSINGWANPSTAKITSPWGPREVICTKGVGCDSGFHHGIDFASACYTPFYAASGGTVTAITYGGTAGDEIVIDYGHDGISTAYSHMFDDGIYVQVGDVVTAGQNIGGMGSTGDSTGCHLYFEYRIDGVTVDPQPAMLGHGITLGPQTAAASQ